MCALQLPLHALHEELGAKFMDFAGYQMPVNYGLGVMGEHLHTRDKAGLFDVSHMGQVRLSAGNWETVALSFETLVPQDVLGLAPGRQRYGFFTNEGGGIEDDLMFARQGDDLLVVVNAACKANDIARMKTLEPNVEVSVLSDRALLALQGPEAGDVIRKLDPASESSRFMDVIDLTIAGVACWASRSGYTGEDGFEISMPAHQAELVARALLAEPPVAPIGLGARDSLRLEAGLCLYGHDIDQKTTPATAGLIWALQKVRRAGGDRAGGYPGEATALAAPIQKRVGLRPAGRAPMREGVVLYADETAQEPIGRITSGTFGPSVGGPVSMGYVDIAYAQLGTDLFGGVRGKRLPVTVSALPFVPANFKR